MEEKLIKLRGGVTLVSPEERKVIEAMYSDAISQWRRRKRMFKDIWDSITENSPKDLKEFKVVLLLSYCEYTNHCIAKHISLMGLCFQEELGIEYDEDVGVSLQSFSDLMQQGKKRAREQ